MSAEKARPGIGPADLATSQVTLGLRRLSPPSSLQPLPGVTMSLSGPLLGLACKGLTKHEEAPATLIRNKKMSLGHLFPPDPGDKRGLQGKGAPRSYKPAFAPTDADAEEPRLVPKVGKKGAHRAPRPSCQALHGGRSLPRSRLSQPLLHSPQVHGST